MSEIFGLVRFYTDDYLPVASFTKRDDLFAFGHRPHANYRRPFVGSQLRHFGFSLRVSNPAYRFALGSAICIVRSECSILRSIHRSTRLLSRL